jgi:hypothetical protein
MRNPLYLLVFVGLLVQGCFNKSETNSDDTNSVSAGDELRPNIHLVAWPNDGLVLPPMHRDSISQRYSARNDRVLMIGDSLSVGGFGESIQDYLLRRFGRNNVAIFAVCGSSPEHWLRSGPDYATKCGYREQTPSSFTVLDFDRGRRPQPVPTPKLEDLLAKYRPTIVIVQLGTNWMDGLVRNAQLQDEDARIMDDFIGVVRHWPDTARTIIWITPPDSSHYPLRVQQTVLALIKNASYKHGFRTIDSSTMTHYIPGKSGGDGVHYASEPAKQWAGLVSVQLDRMVR